MDDGGSTIAAVSFFAFDSGPGYPAPAACSIEQSCSRVAAIGPSFERLDRGYSSINIHSSELRVATLPAAFALDPTLHDEGRLPPRARCLDIP